MFDNRGLLNPGAALARLADRLPRPPGRRQRRPWTGNGRGHIEVRGVQRRENAGAAREVEVGLRRLDGVSWAEVNAPTGRVVVAFDGERAEIADLVAVIEAIEEAHGLAAECFPPGQPDHPGD